MTPIAILVIISFTMLTNAKAMNYTVTRIIDETLTLYNNTRFLLEVIGEGNDSKVFMTINEPITKEDNLYIDIVARRFDGVEFNVPNNPMNLCELLAEERIANSTSFIRQLRVSRVLNLENELCPILPGKRKILPYMFPRSLNTANDLGCGNFNFNINVESISSKDPNVYVSLIATSTIVNMKTRSCSNALM